MKNEEAFYKARNDLNNLHGMKKDAFIEFFDAVREQNKHSLMRNARLLGAEEERIKKEILETVYQNSTDDPDKIRELMSITAGIKQGNVNYIKQSLEHVGEELAGDIQNCWPRDCGVDD